MSEKEKQGSTGPGGSKSGSEESMQSKITSSLKKENEALEEATKKQAAKVSSLAKNIKELKKTEDNQ